MLLCVEVDDNQLTNLLLHTRMYGGLRNIGLAIMFLVWLLVVSDNGVQFIAKSHHSMGRQRTYCYS